MKTRLFTFAALALTLAACTNDIENLNDDSVAAVINAEISDAVATRASGTAWAERDEIGISESRFGYTNVLYRWESGKFTPTGTIIFFQDDDPTTFSAYYPYDADGGTLTATTDATAQQNQPAIDFLYATGATASTHNPEVNFTNNLSTGGTDCSFHHRMSQITLTFQEGSGVDFKTAKLSSYTLSGLVLEGSFDTTTGTAETDANAQTADLTMELDGALTSSVILFPQSTTSIELSVNYNGQPYTATLTIPEGALKAGNNYTYTVNVNATGLTLEGCTIGGWTDGGGESGTAEDLGYFIQDDGSYTVYNANGLKEWAEAVQSDLSLNCTLTEDINMTGKEWTPVGNSGQTYNGTFDGQGYSITGLNASSLFGGIGESATVKNLQLVDVKLNESSGATAGIVVNNYGTIMACSMTGEISAFSFTSGIANFNLGTIVACWFSGTLKENEGYGIVAFNYGTITACFWDGNTTNGYRSNEGGTVEATKVEGTITWQTAVEGMNAALTGNDYQWVLGTDDLPVLQKKQ